MSKIRNLTKSFNQSVQSLKKAAVDSYADFINNINKGYGAGEANNSNKSVGEITISSNNSNAIYAFVTNKKYKDAFMTLAKKRLEASLGHIEGFGAGKNKYNGLCVQQVLVYDLTVDLVSISAVDEVFIVNEIVNCDLNDYENLKKIFTDLNDLFRGYQEMTIDAAKKLYAIMALFYSDVLKAMSTLHLSHNFSKFTGNDDFAFEIARDSKYAVDGKVGEYKEVFNDEGKLIAIAFVDIIGDVQNSAISDMNEVMKDFNNMYKDIQIPEDIRTSWNGVETNHLISDVIAYVKNPYGNLTKWKMDEQKRIASLLEAHVISKFEANVKLEGVKAAFEDELNKISNTARALFKDTDMVTAGFLMFAASNLTKWKNDGFGGITRSTIGLYDEMSTNQFHLKVAPEFYMAYVVSLSEQKNCGYEVFGDVSNLNEGDVLDFVNGMSGDVFVGALYNGKLTVSVVDNKVYAVKPIEIDRVDSSSDSISFDIYGFINGDKFVMENVVESIALFKDRESMLLHPTYRLIKKAEYFIAHPVYNYTTPEGRSEKIYSVIVGYVAKTDELGAVYYLEIPLAKYNSHSCLGKSLLGGLKFNITKPSVVNNGSSIRIDIKMLDYVNNVCLNDNVNENDFESVVSFGTDFDDFQAFEDESSAFGDVDPALFG